MENNYNSGIAKRAFKLMALTSIASGVFFGMGAKTSQTDNVASMPGKQKIITIGDKNVEDKNIRFLEDLPASDLEEVRSPRDWSDYDVPGLRKFLPHDYVSEPRPGSEAAFDKLYRRVVDGIE